MKFVTAFHGTSYKVVQTARRQNRIFGWFDTDMYTCVEYANRKAKEDGSEPVIVEIYVPETDL